MEGYIKISRNILNWEWYNDVTTKILFFHLLLKANYEDAMFQGRVIPRGSLVTSVPHLQVELNLSVQQIRTALKKLKDTGSINIQSTNKYSVIELLHYSDFQDGSNSQITDKPTVRQQTEKPKKEPKPRAKFVAPTVEEVMAYCQERGNGVDAVRFVDYYSSKGWVVGRQPMKDWKSAVRTWERNEWNQKSSSKPRVNDKPTVESEEAIMEAFLRG